MGDDLDFSIVNTSTIHVNEYEQSITIQTHDKRFHVDDVGAISLLCSYYNQKEIKVRLIRSRDPEMLKQADILVDVGGIYDPSINRFDHHQKECNEIFTPNYRVPLSSIGMVWKHIGKELLVMYIKSREDTIENINDHLDALYNEVYVKAIQEIDGHDNGVVPIEGGRVNYFTFMTIGGIISSFNTVDTDDEDAQMKAFEKAVAFFGTAFEVRLEDIIRKYFDFQRSHDIVANYINTYRSGTQYLIIKEKLPTIYKSLNVLDPEGNIKFLIFDEPGNSQITVKTRGRKDDITKPMVPLLSYDTLRNDTLKNICEDDLIFVHKNLFIAKCKTIDCAVRVVEASIERIEQSRHNPYTQDFLYPQYENKSSGDRRNSNNASIWNELGRGGYYFLGMPLLWGVTTVLAIGTVGVMVYTVNKNKD